jgi:hypothetical protein
MEQTKELLSESNIKSLYTKAMLNFFPIIPFSIIVILVSSIRSGFGLFQISFLLIVSLFFIFSFIKEISRYKKGTKYSGTLLLKSKKESQGINYANISYFLIFDFMGSELFIQVSKNVYNTVIIENIYHLTYLKTSRGETILLDITLNS